LHVVFISFPSLATSEAHNRVSVCNPQTILEFAPLSSGLPAHFRNRFKSLSNVNWSGSQNASKNAAAAAEKTE
jgi:hypothetical protein